MFNFYIDDSGTDPNQKVAVAAGVVIPTSKLKRLEEEWNCFLGKYEIEYFHTSACLARDAQFAAWNDDKVQSAFDRVQQLTFKYAVKAYCIAINKDVQEKIIPKHMRDAMGKGPFIAALSSLLGLSYDFAFSRSVPMEYIFESTNNKRLKRDIDEAMEYSETRGYGTHFSEHYTFRYNKESPGLQMADFYAWHAYQLACMHHYFKPCHNLAMKTIGHFAKRSAPEPEKAWSTMQTQNAEAARKWVEQRSNSEGVLSAYAYKVRKKAERIERSKPRKP